MAYRLTVLTVQLNIGIRTGSDRLPFSLRYECIRTGHPSNMQLLVVKYLGIRKVYTRNTEQN